MPEQKQAFIFIGKSGSGKGTQAKLLRNVLLEKDPHTPIVYEETGALFRKFIEEDNYTSHLAHDVMEKGIRQPSFLAVLMWGNMFVKSLNGGEHVIMDGFPRALYEAHVLDSAISFYNLQVTIFYIHISDEEAKRRLTARGREDDNQEGVQKRLEWFQKDVVPAVEYYRAHPTYRFFEINGEVPLEEAHQAILKALA